MAVTSSFFGSINGDRRYKPADFAAFFADFIGNGVYAKPSSGMQVMEKSNMTITVKPGTGFINGYRVNNDSEYDITLATADGVLKRIDRIVLQWDNANRAINIVVKKGAFASNPVVPTIQRDADYYELVLADVLVGAGITRITQASITDQRLNNALCGIVTGLISQVDTTTLFNQYQSWINQQKANYEANISNWTADKQGEFVDWSSLQETDFESWSEQQRTEFDNWFATIKEILDTNVASNLQTQINQLDTNLGQVSNEFTKHQIEYVQFQESKGQPNGFSGLDSEGKVPLIQLPEMNYIPLNEKGQPGGVAALNGNGKIDESQFPIRAMIPSDDILYSSSSVYSAISVYSPTSESTGTDFLKVLFPYGGAYRIKFRAYNNFSGTASFYIYSGQGSQKLAYATAFISENGGVYRDYQMDISGVPANATIIFSSKLASSGNYYTYFRDIQILGKPGYLGNSITKI